MSKRIEGDEYNALVGQIIKRIEDDTQIIGAPERAAVWEAGWAEAHRKFRAKPVADSLIPAFIHGDRPIRWYGDLYHQDAELNELALVRSMQVMVGDYLAECEHISEFGCGTGFNLVALAERFPDKRFMGYDFAESAIALVHEAWNALNLEIGAMRFDMLNPPSPVVSTVPTGCFTFGAVEQLASKFQPFMEHLIACKPKIVVHVEPVVELYDPNNLLDALAISFHKKRGYTEGLLPFLMNDPRVEMIQVRRSHFGSLLHEGYSLLAWKPK